MKTSQQPTSQSGADEWTCSLAALPFGDFRHDSAKLMRGMALRSLLRQFRASLSVMPGDV